MLLLCVDTRDKLQRTPLHCAALVGNTDIVLVLLDSGADPVARDSAGMTPLHLSVSCGTSESRRRPTVRKEE